MVVPKLPRKFGVSRYNRCGLCVWLQGGFSALAYRVIFQGKFLSSKQIHKFPLKTIKNNILLLLQFRVDLIEVLNVVHPDVLALRRLAVLKSVPPHCSVSRNADYLVIPVHSVVILDELRNRSVQN